MKKVIPVIFWVSVCLILGFLSSLLQREAIVEWYPTLQRSPFSPPDWVFPIAWTILYILMGISVGLLHNIRSIYTRFLYLLFGVQLLLNILWSFFFFYMRNPTLGFVDIIMLDIFTVIYFAGSFFVKRISAWLFLPYIIWLAFATYLNGYIMINN